MLGGDAIIVHCLSALVRHPAVLHATLLSVLLLPLRYTDLGHMAPTPPAALSSPPACCSQAPGGGGLLLLLLLLLRLPPFWCTGPGSATSHQATLMFCAPHPAAAHTHSPLFKEMQAFLAFVPPNTSVLPK